MSTDINRPNVAIAGSWMVFALARQEARRLLLHPLALFGFSVCLLGAVLEAAVWDDGPRNAFDAIDTLLPMYPGTLLVVAANLVATRDYRAGSAELLQPLPGRRQDRTLALVVASFAPALLGLAVISCLHWLLLFQGRYEVIPSSWHLLQGPMTLLGACLLGIMVANWTPARGAAAISLVVLIAVNVWLAGLHNGRYFGAYVLWTKSGASDTGVWAGGTYPGSPMWHFIFLAGLCALAAAGALLRVADRRWIVVMTGWAALGVTALGGIGQLP